ncbi:MAG: hypothetical protein R3F11_27140 [Verrucomicrobiales bacterium]
MRANDFLQPLQPGLNLITIGYPKDLSPLDLGLTTANGYTGNLAFNLADQVLPWNGDAAPNTPGFGNYYLIQSGAFEQWTLVGDPTFSNRSAQRLFKGCRGTFMRLQGEAMLRIPAPWTP